MLRPGQRAVDGQQVGHAGLGLRVGDDLAAGVGDRRADLLRVTAGSSSRFTQPAGGRLLLIFLSGDCRSSTRAAASGMNAVGHGEGVAEPAVEPDGEVAGELEVLALVLTHRHLVGLVDQDVGGLQHRVGEQADRWRRRCPRAGSCP